MHKDFDHEFDMLEYQNIEIYRYIMCLYIVNRNYYKHVINQVDKKSDHDQDEMEMNEYNQ
jgi:hypothetical protein